MPADGVPPATSSHDWDEAHYRTLFRSMSEGFCVIEFLDGPHGPLSDYVHVDANPAYARHTGIENVVGQRLREMVPDEADAWLARYGSVLRTGEPIRFEQELVATGRYLEVSSFRVEPPSRRQVAVLFKDVTARKHAERMVAGLNATLEARVSTALAERKLLADIVDGTDALVQAVDHRLTWLAINDAAACMFERLYGVRPYVGYRIPTLLGRRPDDAAKVIGSWQRALAGEDHVEIVTLGADGAAPRSFEMHFSALRDADGDLMGAYQFAYDVTERLAGQERLRVAEEALRQAQKMEAVGQLTGGLAHDFNNLLAGISGAFELIGVRAEQGRTGEIGRYLAAGQGATRRAAALTHRLLAFARRQTLSPEAIVVNRLLGELAELVRRTVGPAIAVDAVAADGLWTTLVDANQLENAILNLCINARDAMPDGGRLIIETGNRTLDERAAHGRAMAAGQYVTVCVSDTGVGIPRDIIDRVFDPFFTTKPLGQGTGLGLSMVYGFARQSNGQVRVHSEVNAGTTVCVYLPRHHGAVAADEGDRDAGPAPATPVRRTVLVVDDEPTVRMLIVEALGDLGHRCLEAEDGPGALAILRGDVELDLLVTDVGLPGGLNGRQVAEAARRERPGLRILFVTGYAENAALNHGHIERGMEVLTKPFSVDDLTRRVARLLATD